MEYSLTDFSKDVLDYILSFLPYNTRTQLNRVCKAFDTAPNIEEHVNYIEKNGTNQNFFNNLIMQIDNPLWINKYGLLPFPKIDKICPEYDVTPKLMEAIKNSNFYAIRTILSLCPVNGIKITGIASDFPFITNKEINPNDTVSLENPYLYPHYFGCNDETTEKIYDFLAEFAQTLRKPGIKLHINIFCSNYVNITSRYYSIDISHPNTTINDKIKKLF